MNGKEMSYNERYTYLIELLDDDKFIQKKVLRLTKRQIRASFIMSAFLDHTGFSEENKEQMRVSSTTCSPRERNMKRKRDDHE